MIRVRDSPAAVFRSEDKVVIGPCAEALLFLVGKRSDDLTGRSYNHGSRGDLRATEDEGLGTDEAVVPDDGTVENDRTHADEAVVTDRAGVDDGGVSHRHAAADGRAEVCRDMDDGIVLNVALLADYNRCDVGSQ